MVKVITTLRALSFFCHLFFKLILLLFFSFPATEMIAQDKPESPLYKKIEIELSIIGSGPGSFITPGLGYATERHAGYVAPVLTYLASDGINSYGLMGGYKFYPNQRSNRTNFYFSFNTHYFKKEKIPNEKLFYFENTIGYGFELRLVEELYLLSDFGLGIQHRSSNFVRINNSWSYAALLKVGFKKRFRKQ